MLYEKKKRSLGNNMQYLIDTGYGWIIGGNLGPKNVNTQQRYFFFQADFNHDLVVKKFWQIEVCEFVTLKYMSEESLCESHFCSNTA